MTHEKKQFTLYYMAWPLFLALFIVVLVSSYLNVLPGGIIGGLAITITIGAVLNEIGNRLPIIKTYFGGGPFIIIFGAAALVHFGILNERTVGIIDTFMRGGGFLDFVIAALITGSILGMNRGLLIRAALGFIPAILGGIAVSLGLVFLVGTITGFGGQEALLLIGVPIMGGGMGAGAVPLSQIFATQTGIPAEDALTMMVPAVALGNALAIISAGILNAIGKKKKGLTGEGKLMKGTDFTRGESDGIKDITLTVQNLGIGLLISLAFFSFGAIIARFIPAIHAYAWMILSVALCKVTGLLPERIEAACAQWFDFSIKNFTIVILVGLGVVFTNLSDIAAALSPAYFLIVATTIVGAILGAGLVGSLFKFFFVEIAITAGLCMANMGGTGDVATLSAAKRMELMPFAQVSSRIGGAIMLLLFSILLSIF